MSRRVHRGPPPDGAREIPGFEGLYYAMPDGRIWSYFSQKFLRHQKNKKDGHPRLVFRRNGLQFNVLVHCMICSAFHGSPSTECNEVKHIDSVKTNLAASNLEWSTRSEICTIALATLPHEKIASRRAQSSRQAKIVSRSRRKLSPAAVAIAREMYERGLSCASIGETVGVSRQVIRLLADGKTYRD